VDELTIIKDLYVIEIHDHVEGISANLSALNKQYRSILVGDDYSGELEELFYYESTEIDNIWKCVGEAQKNLRDMSKQTTLLPDH
jgi:hypothetical protein